MPPEASDSHSNKSLAQKIAVQLHLKDVSKNSFIQLCKKGCDPEFLANHFRFLVSKDKIFITPKRKQRGGKERRTYRVSLRPLDSLGLTLGGLEKRDLKALQKKLINLAKEVDKAKSTRLVRYLSEDELKAHPNIFSLPLELITYANQLIPFLLEKLKQTGERQRPIYTKFLNEICNHIEDKTGKSHYRLLCDILNELDPKQNYNEDTLKQWRNRHKSSSD